MTAKIIFRQLFQLSTLLSLLLLTCGTGIISLLLLSQHQLTTKFDNDLRDIDMVVGAKGSPLQLVLSSVYQLDAPTGNIPLPEAEKLAQHPMVKQAIPLAYGDSYQSFRILGTDSNYLAKYDARFVSGGIFHAPMEAVIGSNIPDLKAGDEFTGMHGLGHTGEEHAEFKYKVVGVLARTNTVLDNLVLTDIQSVWKIHEHAHKDLTALLIKFRTPVAMISLPRFINENTNMQAAIPQLEIKRLFSLMGLGIKTLQGIAFAIVIISGISVFMALYTRLKERKYELALARAMGSSRGLISVFLLTEGLILVFSGTLIGLVVSRVGLKFMAAKYHVTVSNGLLPEEWWLLLGTLFIGILAAVLPALKAFHLNISKTLAHE